MSNQEKLKNYLLGNENKDGYLKREISNGKVIMLSGKWGSGKTHFWQKEIIPKLNNKEEKIPNHYISLYGKTSIEEIKSEIFLKLFESVDSFKSEEKTKNIVKNSIDTALSLANSISVFGISLDLSKISDKSFEKIDDLLENEKLKRTEEYLNSGAIICFDDFERKSKDIDLNDLFGFITQLTLNFKCKVVIILNDDVFEGDEKNIFSHVKEKSVSKFLHYNPSIKELFSLIFDELIEKDGIKIKKYSELMDFREQIQGNFEIAKIKNARIYMQVLDNLLEWVKSQKATSLNFINFFVFNNINFILNHHIYIAELSNKYEKNEFGEFVNSGKKELKIAIKSKLEIPKSISNDLKYFNRLEQLKVDFDNKEKELSFINKNEALIKSNIFLGVMFHTSIIQSGNEIELNVFNEISKFIETGILED